MPHTIIHNPEEGLIEMKLWGNIVWREADELILEILQVLKDRNCFRVLSDYRDARIQLSVFEIYEIPKKVSEILATLGLSDAIIKRAILAKKDVKDLDFFETATFNRGQHMKVFDDAAEAKEWLFEK